MTTIKKSFFAALFLISLTASATDFKTIQSETKQIQNILQRTDFTDIITNTTTVKVNFIVNSHDEIIIVSTDNESLDQIIKDVLNYKKLDITVLKRNEIYTLPITIK